MRINKENWNTAEELRDRVYDAIDSIESAMTIARELGDESLRSSLNVKRVQLKKKYDQLNKKLNAVYQKELAS